MNSIEEKNRDNSFGSVMAQNWYQGWEREKRERERETKHASLHITQSSIYPHSGGGGGDDDDEPTRVGRLCGNQQKSRHTAWTEWHACASIFTILTKVG